MSIVIVNQQRLLWNVYHVATIVVRKQINFQSAVLRSERSSCWVITLGDFVQCDKMDSSGVVISLPKSNSLNETILLPTTTTTTIQTPSILTEFDENLDL